MPGSAQRSGFNGDFSKLAAVQSFGSGWHIGTLEATDDPKKVSKFKDLSGDEKGIGRPVTQSTGAFGPDGKLNVLEQNDSGTVVKAIDPSSGKPETLNIQLGWKEHDENGDLIDVKATTESSPYFLPNGKTLEASPTPHTVYSPNEVSVQPKLMTARGASPLSLGPTDQSNEGPSAGPLSGF
jgi:hypothetical protein